MFIDKVRISVKAGAGGNGAIAFHREKYVAAGGPDGGDGGNGGSIVLRVDDNLSTLMDFRYKRKYVAPNGMDGQGKRCTGKDGEDLVLRVPRGTIIRDAETQEAADLRNQAWEQAANGIDDETTRRIWQQVDTVTAREAERLRAQVRKLIGLLNAGRPALDENGYPMWDHLIALSNRQCWQWEIAAAHSGCLAAIMQAAGIDDWPPADSMPDITNPVITINLSTNQ